MLWSHWKWATSTMERSATFDMNHAWPPYIVLAHLRNQTAHKMTTHTAGIRSIHENTIYNRLRIMGLSCWRPWIFWWNNAHSDRAWITMDALWHQNFNLLDWPPHSLYMLPFEHLWDELRRQVYNNYDINISQQLEQVLISHKDPYSNSSEPYRGNFMLVLNPG